MPLQQPDSVSIGSVLSPYRMARHGWKRNQGPLTGLQSNSRIRVAQFFTTRLGQGTHYRPVGMVALFRLVAGHSSAPRLQGSNCSNAISHF
jgi:hypothetical protein